MSEVFAKILGFIKEYWAVIGGSISIPVIVGFACKWITGVISKKKAIKDAVLSSTKALENKITEIDNKLDAKLCEIEQHMFNKLESHFEQEKQTRIDTYNRVMEGVDHIDNKLLEMKEIEPTDISNNIKDEFTDDAIKNIVDDIKNISVENCTPVEMFYPEITNDHKTIKVKKVIKKV